MDKKIEQTMNSLNKNNFEVFNIDNPTELPEILNRLIKDDETVSFGGSMTLFESEAMPYLQNRSINLLDRNVQGLSYEDIQQIYRDSFAADTYLTSSNAITEDGYLYNVDGNGNRVAAMIWGPKQVIVIAGANKIVKNEAEAIKRNREVAAPLNAKRLNKNTPCVKLGYCTDCTSDERICMSYVTIRRPKTPGRIKVILINGNYGY